MRKGGYPYILIIHSDKSKLSASKQQSGGDRRKNEGNRDEGKGHGSHLPLSLISGGVQKSGGRKLSYRGRLEPQLIDINLGFKGDLP